MSCGVGSYVSGLVPAGVSTSIFRSSPTMRSTIYFSGSMLTTTSAESVLRCWLQPTSRVASAIIIRCNLISSGFCRRKYTKKNGDAVSFAPHPHI